MANKCIEHIHLSEAFHGSYTDNQKNGWNFIFKTILNLVKKDRIAY